MRVEHIGAALRAKNEELLAELAVSEELEFQARANARRYLWLRENAMRLSFPDSLIGLLLRDVTELDSAIAESLALPTKKQT